MATYLVPPSLEPGVQVADVGFFRPGQEFTAPKEWVPSRGLIPMDAEAKSALKRAKKAYADKLEESRREANQDAKYTLPEHERKAIEAMPDKDEDPLVEAGFTAPGNTPSPKGADKDPPKLPEGKEAQARAQAEDPKAGTGKRTADR